MVYLAKCFKLKKICPLKEISEAEGIPFDFLEKIISKLEKAGLVKAKKGIQGGYFLAKKPKQISVKQILEVLEKTILLVKCFGCQRIKKCRTKNVWKKIEDSLILTLKSINLADLIK